MEKEPVVLKPFGSSFDDEMIEKYITRRDPIVYMYTVVESIPVHLRIEC